MNAHLMLVFIKRNRTEYFTIPINPHSIADQIITKKNPKKMINRSIPLNFLIVAIRNHCELFVPKWKCFPAPPPPPPPPIQGLQQENWVPLSLPLSQFSVVLNVLHAVTTDKSDAKNLMGCSSVNWVSIHWRSFWYVEKKNSGAHHRFKRFYHSDCVRVSLHGCV